LKYFLYNKQQQFPFLKVETEPKTEMATALLNALPYDVASKVNDYTAELSVTKRLNSGWRELHKELEWRVGGPQLPIVPMRWPGYLVLKQTPIVPPYFLPLYSRLEPAMCQHIPTDVEYSFATRYSTKRGQETRQLNSIIMAAGILLGLPTLPKKDSLGEWIEIERAVAVANETPFNELPDFPEDDESDTDFWETDGEDWQGADWEPDEEDWDF
jgi:hypothetical protein